MCVCVCGEGERYGEQLTKRLIRDLESVNWPITRTIVSISVVVHHHGVAVRRETEVEEVATPPGSAGAHLQGCLKNNVVLITVSAKQNQCSWS